MSNFNVTQMVYMIASNRIVQPVVINSILEDDWYVVGYESSEGLCVSESQLFVNRDEAEDYLKQCMRARRGVRQY